MKFVKLQELAELTLGFNIGKDKLSKFNRENVSAPHDYAYNVLSLKAFNSGVYLGALVQGSQKAQVENSQNSVNFQAQNAENSQNLDLRTQSEQNLATQNGQNSQISQTKTSQTQTPPNTEPFSSATPLSEKFLLRENDILVKLVAPISALFVQNAPQSTIFPHSMVKIRLKNVDFNPKFLAFYLNSNHAKRQLARKIMQSSFLTLIKVSDLAGLEIPLLSPFEQEKAVRILDLAERKNTLLNALLGANQRLSRAVLSHFVGENSRNFGQNSRILNENSQPTIQGGFAAVDSSPAFAGSE